MSSSQGEAAMKDLAGKANDSRLQRDVDAMKHDISSLADQISDALETLAGSAKKQARAGHTQARSNADSIVSGLSKHGNAALAQAKDAAAAVGDTLEDAVQQRPLAAVGLALGLGVLIGATWHR